MRHISVCGTGKERLKDYCVSWEKSGFTEMGRMVIRCKANKFAVLVKVRSKFYI